MLKIVSEKVIEAKGNSWFPFENQTFSDGLVSNKKSAFSITCWLKPVLLKADGSSKRVRKQPFPDQYWLVGFRRARKLEGQIMN